MCSSANFSHSSERPRQEDWVDDAVVCPITMDTIIGPNLEFANRNKLQF